jgi:hypothetical protein
MMERCLWQNNLSIAGRAHSGQLFDAVHGSGFAEGTFWRELKIKLTFFNQKFIYPSMEIISIFGGRFCSKTKIFRGF